MAVVLSLGRLFERILARVDYNKLIKLKNGLERLNKSGFRTELKGAQIQVFEKLTAHSLIYSLRPFTTDLKVFDQVIVNNEYAPVIEIIQRYQRESRIKFIVDAGANIGLTSLYLLAHYPESYIVAIEPDKDNFRQLCENLQKNHLNERCLPLLKALWKNSTDYLNINNSFRDGGHWSRSISLIEGSNSIGTTFPITLAEIVQLNKKEELIDLLKLDVEGVEFILFDDLLFQTILKQKVKFLSLEIHPEVGEPKKILDFLIQNNFTIVDKNQTVFCFNRSLLFNGI